MIKPADLPKTLSVFRLPGALLLPRSRLPLHIFEPRYLQMLEDALKTPERLIGMVQPKSADTMGKGDIYQTGCAGKITEFTEETDGRYLITLSGICRFHISDELETQRGYRNVKPDWGVFKTDVETKKCLGVDREKLHGLLEAYFEREGMSCDFDKFEGIEDGKLMTCLSMVCPFEPSEKQALLEQVCCVERAQMFMTMVEMAIKSGKPLDKSKHQCH